MSKYRKKQKQKGFQVERRDGKTYLLKNFKEIKPEDYLSHGQKRKLLREMHTKLRQAQGTDCFDVPLSILVFNIDRASKTCDYCLCPIKTSLLEGLTTEITPAPMYIINYHSSRFTDDDICVWIEQERYM